MKYTADQIRDSLSVIDCGYSSIGKMTPTTILLYNDDNDTYLTLLVSKDRVKVKAGHKLVKGEKGKYWKFEEYANLEQLTDSISNFTKEYFNSFHLVRKIKKKTDK